MIPSESYSEKTLYYLAEVSFLYLTLNIILLAAGQRVDAVLLNREWMRCCWMHHSSWRCEQSEVRNQGTYAAKFYFYATERQICVWS